MEEIYGNWNKILRVDLTSRTIREESMDSSIYRKFLGGAGLGSKIMYSEVSSRINPLGPENKILFCVGPYQATKLPGSAKWSLVSKSPLTETYAESSAGGKWGAMFKKAGYDLLIIEGHSDKPVYLWICDGRIEIRQAGKIWGLDSIESIERISREIGERKASVATIGPAGERLVYMACLVVDGHSFAGRCGIGAVMGSKNLKAVAVYGTGQPPISNHSKVENLTEALRKKIRKYSKEESLLTRFGTPAGFLACVSLGDTPIKNWSLGSWKDAEKLGIPRYNEILKPKPYPCIYCPIGCHRHIKIEKPSRYELEGAGPEYETLGMLGANCLVDDIKAVAKANDLCNRFGMDTISAGACVSFAMECFERGWLTLADTGGMHLEWGNADSLVELIRQIGLGKGLGRLFSKGTLNAARKIGNDAEKIVVHVRGLDLPAHDPRACFGLAPNYATSTRGACHQRGNVSDVEQGGMLLPEIGIKEKPELFKPFGKSRLAVKMQNLACVFNSLVICEFMVNGGGMTLTEVLECLNAISGLNWTIQDFEVLGERIFNLQRLVNIRDGKGADYDKLPPRMFQAASTGFRKNKVPPFEELLREYYEIRGWDKGGYPLKATLERLSLETI